MKYFLFFIILMGNTLAYAQGNIPLHNFRHANGADFIIRSGVNGKAEWIKDTIYFPKVYTVSSTPITAKKGDFWRSTANGNTYLWDGTTWQLIAKMDNDTSSINELIQSVDYAGGFFNIEDNGGVYTVDLRDTLFGTIDTTGLVALINAVAPIRKDTLFTTVDTTGLVDLIISLAGVGSGNTLDSISWSNITNKPITFTPSTHTHLINDVTGLQDSLNLKANINLHNHTNGIYLNDSLFINDYAPDTSHGGNIFIGHRAGNNTMTNDGSFDYFGAGNSIVGQNALKANTTGFYNSGIGFESMMRNTTGAGNAFVGGRALFYNIDGWDNAAMGDNALYSNTSGRYNQGIGYKSLYSNTIGYRNSALGQSAMFGNVSGSDNIGIGYASASNMKKGNFNTFIGTNTSTTLDSVSNSVAIGNGATITDHSQLVLGSNTIQNVIVSGTIHANKQGGNIRLRADGTGDKDGGFFTSQNGDFYFANWNITRGLFLKANGDLTNLGTGNFGIGTTSPTAKLDVVGSAKVSGTFEANASGANVRLRADGTDNNDFGLFTTQDGRFYLSNWNITRGLFFKANGEISVIGNSLFESGKLKLNTIQSYASTTAAAADGALLAGTLFKVSNGDGTSALHIKD